MSFLFTYILQHNTFEKCQLSIFQCIKRNISRAKTHGFFKITNTSFLLRVLVNLKSLSIEKASKK